MSSDKKISLQVSDGSSMDAYVAFPEGAGPFPAIIVLQEAFGVNAHIRNMADRFAKEGYVAVAPELFHRTGQGLEFGYTDFAVAIPHMQAMNTEGQTADLEAVFKWLQQQENVSRNKIASVGFCLGGRVSFLANSILPLSAAVSYYGSRIQTLSDYAKQLHAPQLFFWGGLDKHIPTEQIDEVKKVLDEAGKKYSSIVFPQADHGFNCDERSSYNPAAAKEAWIMTLDFLRKSLN